MPEGAANWHTDGAYDEVPFKATQLYALAVPSTGGDTLFASMYAAYDALPEDLKKRVGDRLGAFTYGGRKKAAALLNPEDRDRTRRPATGSRPGWRRRLTASRRRIPIRGGRTRSGG